ncbi:MAG: domain containing protein [Labilithrix sp.]|nr:domain containing protein [Labilithrix sp.]
MYLVVPPGGCFPETRRIELGPGALTIGRAEGCEIRVDVPGVDQEHAKISEVALIALGPDCAIGDVPLEQGSRRLVMPGDEIQIGSVVVALEGTDPSLVPPPPGGLRGTDPMIGAPHKVEAPRVRVVEGSPFGDELMLTDEGREYLIGRGPKCDLVLDDREVSREHVKVMRKGYSVYVQDLSSTRGSWLGRSTVYTGATVEWSRPRMLRVGATVLSLELPEAIRRSAPGAQASAPMTPPPRRKGKGSQTTTPSPGGVAYRGSNALTPAPSQPPPGSAAAAAVAEDAKATRKIGQFQLDGSAAMVPHVAPPPGVAMAPSVAPAPGSSPRLGSLPPPSRKAWKKTGPTIGKASGLLLLALAGLVILGGLFVVFSLLE